MGIKNYHLLFQDAKQVAEETTQVTFRAKNQNLTFQAGQYFRITIPGQADNVEGGNTRDFTIASSPNSADSLTIVFRNSNSPYKQALINAPFGMKVIAQGPFGVFVLPKDKTIPLVFLAGGIGITPFLSMVRFICENKLPYKIQLLYGNSTKEKEAYIPELLELASLNKNFVFTQRIGLLDIDFIKSKVIPDYNAHWYICGLPQMVLGLVNSLSNKLDINSEQIITEEFSGYETGSRDNISLKLSSGNFPDFISEDIGLDKKVLEAMILAAGQSALVSVTDPQGSILYANKKFIDTSKYSSEELLGQNHRILKSGYHPPEFFEELWKTISGGKIWRNEIKNRAKDGTFYWVDATISPVFDSAGKIKRYVAVRFLISEKKEIDRVKRATLNLLEDLETERTKLAEAKAKDEAMLACIGDGLLAIGLDKKILLMNNTAKAMLNCQDKEVLARRYTDFFSVIDKDGKIVPDESLFSQLTNNSTNVIKANDFYYVPKNGGIKFPVDLTIAPITLHGKIIGVIDVFRDISHEKAVDRAKTEFVSLASHQLRTPLTTVSWYIEMLLENNKGNLDDKQKKYLDEVYKGNRRMVIMVNTLLNVSRLELGTFAIRPEPTDVIKLESEVAGELKFQIDLKELVFEERLGEGMTRLNIDPKQLSLVLQNLLTNSIKYTPNKGRVGIDIRVVKPGELVGKQKINIESIAIVVADTGFGIPKKQQDKIFTKLFRGDNVRDKDTDGTGLGLYIVKSIVDNSGGKIWFESPARYGLGPVAEAGSQEGYLPGNSGGEKNQGTVFYVTLPLNGMRKK